MPVRKAVARPCARGVPPPQGSDSRRRLARVTDLLGGSSTWQPHTRIDPILCIES